MNKVVCITGCCGFIGNYVTRACLDEGWYVVGIDKLTYAANPKNIVDFEKYSDHFKFIKSDINDITSLPEVDYIINTAAESHVDNSIVSSNKFLQSNINGVHHLLELIRSKNTFQMPTLIHFSTDEVYGDISEGSHTETDLLKPSNPYSATKAAADMLIAAWARTFKVPYIIVRPTNNYGIGQYTEKLIPKTCKFIQLGKKIPLHNWGLPKRTWLHAKDTADAIVSIINKAVEGSSPDTFYNDNRPNNQIFNIGGNCEIENWKIVAKIGKILTQQDYFLELVKKDLLSARSYAHKKYPHTKYRNLSVFHYIKGVKGICIITNMHKICDFSYHRSGQDIRYSLNDNKLKELGWNNKCDLDKELPVVVKYYQENYIW